MSWIPHIRRTRAIRSLRKRAAALGVDVTHLTDEELEARLVENSRTAASKIAAGVGKTAGAAASRMAALARALIDPDKKQ